MYYENTDEYWRSNHESNNNNEQENCECVYIIRKENIVEINEMTYDLNELTNNDYDIICPRCNCIMCLED